MTGYLVFDANMDSKIRDHCLLYFHKTPYLLGSTYAGVVFRNSVRMNFTYAALNILCVCTIDIINAYLQYLSSQKYYIIFEIEFVLENLGEKEFTRISLHDYKSVVRDFRHYMRACMRQFDFVS